MSAGLSPADPLLGRVLGERYEILHRLGEGAMGVVYKARHVKFGRAFAVKVLHARALQDAKVARRFEREAELAGRLRHPNVIGVVDVGEVDGTRYMVMDLAEGPDLAKLLDEAPMPADRIIGLVRPLLEGLYHAHEQGLIHRDFKPENVIVERDTHGAEVPRIVDFGIALLREGSDSGDGAGRLTTNGLVLGTPHYMAPEQAVADPIDHRIDLFALGIVIYEMLSGRLPFDGSGAEVARANLLLDPPPISRRVPHLEVDPLLEALSRRLMAKKRTQRPATAKAARELLDLIDRDRPAAALALGVPIDKSGRLPAATESVTAGDSTGVTDLWQVTTRMKPTPRTSAPVAPPPRPAGPGAPGGPPPQARGPGAPEPPAGAAVPSWMMPEVADASAPIGTAGVPFPVIPAGRYRPHRDTGLGTPLGWQTASLPSRRRSWLIGGAVVGTACIVVATVLTLAGADQDEPASGAPVAAAGSAVSPTRAPGDAKPPGITAGDSPARAAAPPAPPEPSSGELRAADPAAAAKPRATVPARPSSSDGKRAATIGRNRARPGDTALRGPGDPATAPAGTAAMHAADLAAAPAGTSATHSADRPAAAADTAPPRVETPSAPPSGISASDLGVLFDQVRKEIEQLPEDHRADLLDQLAMLNIMRALRGSGPVRDDAAAQLSRLRQRARERQPR